MSEAQRRLHHLLLLLAYGARPGGCGLSELARRLGVSPSRVQSYAHQLLMCGRYPFAGGDFVDVTVDAGRVRVYVDQQLGQPVQLTQPEALALSFALGALQGARGQPYAALAASALRKIRARLAGDVEARVADLEQRIAIQPEDHGVGERFERLARAVRDRRAVDITYYTASRDAITRRRVNPYLLVQNLGFWYLVALDQRSDEERIFKVERVKRVRSSTQRFSIPASFSAERYRREPLFASSRTRQARVRFHPPLARIVGEEWPAARLHKERGGRVVARMDFTHAEGLAAWILSMGDRAEVLEPEDLRAAVVARCRAALRAGGT